MDTESRTVWNGTGPGLDEAEVRRLIADLDGMRSGWRRRKSNDRSSSLGPHTSLTRSTREIRVSPHHHHLPTLARSLPSPPPTSFMEIRSFPSLSSSANRQAHHQQTFLTVNLTPRRRSQLIRSTCSTPTNGITTLWQTCFVPSLAQRIL